MATCSSADSVLEAASQIKSNATKLNTFVNGTASQTVQLGTGDPTPTLRKFVADAQDVVTQAALDAGQTVLDDVAQNTADIATLQSGKADKRVPAEAGNLAELDSTGNICDAGRATDDFVLLLAYAHDEALGLATMNQMNIAAYNDWYKHGVEKIEGANAAAVQAKQNIRSLIDTFDLDVARYRLQLRLFGGTNPGASSKPVLFVASGQSNGVGSGLYYPFETAEDCGWFWSWADGANALKPLKDPTGQFLFASKRSSGYCSFAKRFFALTGRKVIILNISSNGSAVTDAGYTTTNTWADNGYGTLRSSRQEIWDAFDAAVPASSYDVGAILWVQGEAEAGRLYSGTVSVADYKDATLDVFSWMRTMISDADCPVFISKIGYTESCLTNPELYNAFVKIQEAQDALCDYETIFPGFSLAPFFADAWDEYLFDFVHYSPTGYRILGNCMARSVVNYLNF